MDWHWPGANPFLEARQTNTFCSPKENKILSNFSICHNYDSVEDKNTGDGRNQSTDRLLSADEMASLTKILGEISPIVPHRIIEAVILPGIIIVRTCYNYLSDYSTTNSQDPKSHGIFMQARAVIGWATTNAMALGIMAITGSGPW